MGDNGKAQQLFGSNLNMRWGVPLVIFNMHHACQIHQSNSFIANTDGVKLSISLFRAVFGITTRNSSNFWALISILKGYYVWQFKMFCNEENGHFYNFNTYSRIRLYLNLQCLKYACQAAIEYHFWSSKLLY